MLEENSTYQLDGKNLKYGENKTNHIFTIDNTNVLKKKVHNFQNGIVGKVLKI